MSDPRKPPLLLSILAALTPFGGAPVLFAAGALVSGGQFEQVREAFQEGGWVMPAVLGLGAVMSLVMAVLLFFGTYRPTPVALGVLPVSLVLAALGAFGMNVYVRQTLAAVAMVNPDDRIIITCAGVGEASQAAVMGLLATGALLLAVVPGFLLGALAHLRDETSAHRRMMGLAGLGSLSTGLWCVVAAWQLSAFAGGYKALAHAAPMDRMVILAGSMEEGAALGKVSLALAVVALVVFLAGAAWLRGAPVSATALGALGVVTLGGAAGLVALCGAARQGVWSVVPLETVSLMPLGASMGAETPGLVVKGGTLTWRGEAIEGQALVDRLEQLTGHRDGRWRRETDRDGLLVVPVVDLGLAADAEPTAVHGLLRTLVDQEVATVVLVGQRRHSLPPELPVRPEFAPLIAALGVEAVAAPVRVGRQGKLCPDGCTFATVTASGVRVGNEEWTNKEEEPFHRLEGAPRLVFVRADPTLAPAVLARGAVTALTHDAQLVLVF